MGTEHGGNFAKTFLQFLRQSGKVNCECELTQLMVRIKFDFSPNFLEQNVYF